MKKILVYITAIIVALAAAIGVIIGGLDFSSLSLKVGDASIAYGNFIQTVIDFLIVAFCIFAALKIILAFQNKFKKKEEIIEEAVEEAKEPEIPEEQKLLMEIRDLLKK